MGIETLFTDPLRFLIFVVVILASLSFHEFAHAWAGYLQGDDTAKDQGRLTLNPKAHIDPIGLIALVTVGFGWGKPVPFNQYNLRNQKWGPFLVAFAGPMANVVLAILAAASLKSIELFTDLTRDNALVVFLGTMMVINITLFVFNLIPIPPLDGSKFLFTLLSHPKHYRTRMMLELRGPMLLILFILADNFMLGGRIMGTLFGTVLAVLTGVFHL